MKKSKPYVLDISSEEYTDFDIFSITSTQSIYRVIHELNTELSIDLQLNDLLEFTHTNGEEFFFPLYTFYHEDINIEFNLLPNQTSFQPKKNTENTISDLFSGDIEQSAQLIPELQNTDYFLIIKGDNRYLYNHQIFDTIKLNQVFILVTEIYFENLKDKKTRNNLIF